MKNSEIFRKIFSPPKNVVAGQSRCFLPVRSKCFVTMLALCIFMFFLNRKQGTFQKEKISNFCSDFLQNLNFEIDEILWKISVLPKHHFLPENWLENCLGNIQWVRLGQARVNWGVLGHQMPWGPTELSELLSDHWLSLWGQGLLALSQAWVVWGRILRRW